MRISRVYYTLRNILYSFVFIARQGIKERNDCELLSCNNVESGALLARSHNIDGGVLMNNDISDNNAGSAERIMLPLRVCKLVVYPSYWFVIWYYPRPIFYIACTNIVS